MSIELERALFDLEEKFWRSGLAFYRQNLAEGVLMVFPEPVGILVKEQVMEAVTRAPRWTSVEFAQRWLVEISAATAIIAYRAVARREGDPAPYVVLASSAYVPDGRSWKLAFHQQTPAASAA